jgi:SAM-dependent methyltransferase/DNA-binding transcriptional ArsR family regulator
MDLEGNTTLLSLFADSTRVRLTALLHAEELTVAELTRITGLPQSRVSSHLARLRDAGVLVDRKVGTSTFYRADTELMPVEARRIWELVRDSLDDGVLVSDAQRCVDVVRARTDSAAWPDLVAGRMEHHYSPGRTWEATARGFLGLMHLGDVLDLGSGDGVMAQLLAPRSRSVTCLDRSDKVITAARERLASVPNIRFALGDMHDVPLPDASFDHVLMFNVLTYAAQPEAVLTEAFRLLRPKGELAVVTLDEHEHIDVSAAYQHVNAGFAPDRLRALLQAAGFELSLCEVSSRERRKPYFQVVTAFARRPAATAKRAAAGAFA